MSVTDALLRGGFALVVSLACAPAVLTVLRRRKILDHPSARSSHVGPVPRGGGIAPAVGALAAFLLASSTTSSQRWTVVFAAGLFGLIGLVEDVAGIRAVFRLGFQFAIAFFCVLFLLDGLTGSGPWQALFGAATIFWIVAFVNAYNFMDGINGISVAQAVGAGATWLVVGQITNTLILASGGAIIAGAVLGFGPFNLPKARMFLGDVGSYFIGAWLASVAVLGLRAKIPPEAVLAPLALYLADTGITLARRVARGEPWHEPHRDHAYQRLADSGWSHVQVSAVVAGCIGLCGALGAVSLSGSLAARVAADVSIASVIGGYLISPRWLASRADSRRVELA
jgi:UDP-GlcNAc:undecaprenyl-phosphate GlcNAc-1-phosphate transferase